MHHFVHVCCVLFWEYGFRFRLAHHGEQLEPRSPSSHDITLVLWEEWSGLVLNLLITLLANATNDGGMGRLTCWIEMLLNAEEKHSNVGRGWHSRCGTRRIKYGDSTSSFEWG